MTSSKKVSDLYLKYPKTIESFIVIKNIKPIGNQSLDCDIQSPWANIARTVSYTHNKVLVHQKMEIKTKWIEGAELESEAFKKLQLAIEQHFNKGIAIVFTNTTQDYNNPTI